jgi:hypothetical protein
MISVTNLLLLCVYFVIFSSELSWLNRSLFVEGYLPRHRHLQQISKPIHIFKSTRSICRCDRGVVGLSASGDGTNDEDRCHSMSNHSPDSITSTATIRHNFPYTSSPIDRPAPPSRNDVAANIIKKFCLTLLLLGGAALPISNPAAMAGDLALSKVDISLTKEFDLPASIIDKSTDLNVVKPLTLDNSRPTSKLSLFSESLNRLRSGFTGVKVTELRVGESLVRRLRSIEQELNQIQEDIFVESVDWGVISVYPKIFRAYAPLFTAYTDRAFPSSSPVDISLRYALRYEIGGFYSGIKDFEDAVEKKSQRQLQRAFARISLAYDRYYKAGDLYREYDVNDQILDPPNLLQDREKYLEEKNSIPKLSYIAPSIEAPSLQDEVVLLKGPDKGRKGVVLWIAKGDNVEISNVVIKFAGSETSSGSSGHYEVKLYPYNFVAKTTPPEVQFLDDLVAAYVASMISCGIMYPIDSYKTRLQIGKRGLPEPDEGGFFGLYKGVQYFVLDANDAVYGKLVLTL